MSSDLEVSHFDVPKRKSKLSFFAACVSSRFFHFLFLRNEPSCSCFLNERILSYWFVPFRGSRFVSSSPPPAARDSETDENPSVVSCPEDEFLFRLCSIRLSRERDSPPVKKATPSSLDMERAGKLPAVRQQYAVNPQYKNPSVTITPCQKNRGECLTISPVAFKNSQK